eukprot:gene9157-18972_t
MDLAYCMPSLIPPLETTTYSKELVVELTFLAKWRGIQYKLDNILPHSTTVGDIKRMLEEQTAVCPKRQKLIGLGKLGQLSSDDLFLSSLDLKIKCCSVSFTMTGTPEIEIIQLEENNQQSIHNNEILNDFDLSCSPSTMEWHKISTHVQKTEISFINLPRDGKKLLVLDLDHTLLDFTHKHHTHPHPHEMKRPHLDHFMTTVYEYYDIAIWSQTHWKWLELKLTELDMLTHPNYKICFVLDKSSMFRNAHSKYVKPLQIIWSKFPDRWSRRNTVHVDDVARNFYLNPQSGLLVRPFFKDGNNHRRSEAGEGIDRPGHHPSDTSSSSSSSSVTLQSQLQSVGGLGTGTGKVMVMDINREDNNDSELLELSRYLVRIATATTTMNDFTLISHESWRAI